MNGLVPKILWNLDERRLRAPWRIAVTTLLIVALTVTGWFALVAFTAPGSGGEAAVGDGLTRLTEFAPLVLLGAATIAAVSFSGTFLDRRYFTDFGLHVDRDWWTDLGVGFGLGTALMTLVFLVEYSAGWVSVEAVFSAPLELLVPELLFSVALFVFVGFHEELLFRGYLVTNLAEGLFGHADFDADRAVGGAIVASAAVFALLHATNPGATVVSTLGVGFAGVLLAFAYVLTGEIALPVGFHVSWNVFQGPVFGLPVSGVDPTASLLVVNRHGPNLYTGGVFGPEAGLLGVSALSIGCLLVAAWTKRRYGRVVLYSGLTEPDLRRR
ncbi:CPBP family intramembrane glutamic endopeptidase [Haloprofundus salilacus]|uniref:CPBP family intramembrane glutamic endopeptidase n=1 Tax=Haloprofundus salilacus TaxID=2876190 RepID=UPI001CD02493|nr:CPBP family intramembrane glutamic endopeptidase [Haloprofundus salilacus]